MIRKEFIPEAISFIKKEWAHFLSLKLKRDYLVFMVFFLLSMFFWLLKSLNKTYETDFSFPVRFTNKPGDVILGSDLPKTIEITIRDAGFQLLRSSLTPNFRSANINLQDLMMRRDRKLNDNRFFVLTRDFSASIQRSLPSTSQLLSISPDTLHVLVSKQVKSVVPVRLVANISAGKQHLLSGSVSFEPDSVTVYGASIIIDTLSALYTEYMDLRNLTDTTRRTIKLKRIDGVDYSDSDIDLIVPVEMFTEKTLGIPVTGAGFPDSLNLRAFPGIVDVSFFVGVSNYQTVTVSDFEVFVNYNDIVGKVSGEIPVKVRSKQKWLTNIRLSPTKINYLLELK